jgi:hypothetical protein
MLFTLFPIALNAAFGPAQAWPRTGPEVVRGITSKEESLRSSASRE